MNKKGIMIFFAVVLTMALLVGCGNQAPVAVDPSASEAQGQSGEITLEEAKNIALEHSGVSAADAGFVRADYEWDDRSYEIEFYADQVEYDYEIDAVTGTIIAYDSEIEGFVIGENTTRSGGNATITEEEAKSVALNHAGFTESRVKGLRATYEREDGRSVYEVEFRDGFTEYSYDIDAETGEILSYDVDND